MESILPAGQQRHERTNIEQTDDTVLIDVGFVLEASAGQEVNEGLHVKKVDDAILIHIARHVF